MGKAAKKRRATDRMKRKRQAKEAKRQLYEQLAAKKRQRAKSVEPGKFDHETTGCGNPGCAKCFRPTVTRVFGYGLKNVGGRLVLT
jgi:hypothetical protein